MTGYHVGESNQLVGMKKLANLDLILMMEMDRMVRQTFRLQPSKFALVPRGELYAYLIYATAEAL
jgi:hypothetical protein